MLGGMTVCKVSAGDLARPVLGMSVGQSENFLRKSSHCVFVHVSSCVSASTSSSGRQACPLRVATRLGSSFVVDRRGVVNRINVFYGAPNSRPREQRFDFGYTISFTSLSRMAAVWSRKIPSGRLHCKAGARLSNFSKAFPIAVEKSISDKFRGIASDSREASSREATSPSISSPPSWSEGSMPVNLAAGGAVVAVVFMMVVLGFVAKPCANGEGSVSDLIRRGQLRSDRGADSKNLTYDDPFNNPLVKMGKKNPIVRMCGKMFRLAPVVLTDEKVAKHQNRRIQAYKWKRPIVFLNEGDPVPEGVDSEEIRWIPSNHPFATTSNFIDEDLARKNVYQTRGVPSRVRAEHEALQKKIYEAAQGEPEFQLPNMGNSGAQAWKTSDETSKPSGRVSGDECKESDSTLTFGKQVNGNGGPLETGGVQDGTRRDVSESRYRTIDFSGEEQGSGRT